MLVAVVLVLVSIGSYTASAQPIRVTENFDAGTTIPSGWSTQQLVGTVTWQFNTPATIGRMGSGTWLGGAFSSPNIAAFRSFDGQNGDETRLITPIIDFTSVASPQLTFQFSDVFNSSADYIVVEGSNDGGTTWTSLATFATRGAGATNNWLAKSVDISAYASQSNVRFAFKGHCNYGYNFAIDNVFIGQPPANDVGVTAITLPPSTAFRTPNTVTASVKNFGTADQGAGAFNVHVKTWKTVGGSEGSPEFHQMEAAPAILAGATASFSFATQWTPAEYVAYTVKVYTELTGDETPANDAFTKSVTVVPATDLQVTAVVYPTTTGLYTGTLGYAVRGTVKNNGTSTVLGSDYTVDGWIGPTAGFPGSATYTGAATFKPDIAPGASVNVDLLPSAWVPVDPGLHTVRIKVTMAGDEIPSNDTRDESRTVLSVHFGGPDGGGYYYITDGSTNPAKPTYNWLDITGVGTPLNFTSDDQNSADITIPSFTLYGNAYTSLRVNNNGHIRFDGSVNSSYYTNPSIPSTTPPNYLLAPFWDDMGLVAGTTNIYYYNDAPNNQFIIEFYQMPFYGQTTDLKTFEVVLNYSTNSIFFQYNTMPGGLSGSTIGIEGSGATGMGTQWLYNGAPAPAVTALVSGRVIYFGTSSSTVPAIASLTQFYTLNVTATNGTVTKFPDQTSYASGTSVQLTATANPGYSFSGWSGDASGSTNPLTIIMDGNKNITATFTLNAITIDVAMNAGWNLVSVPVTPASFSVSALFPAAIPGTIYSFLTGAYVSQTTLQNGEGYWAYYASAGNNSITGDAITTSSVTVAAGNRWVLIGSVSTTVPTSALVSNPVGVIVPGTLWGFNGTAYSTPTQIEPGKAYWVFVNAPCTLTTGSGGLAPSKPSVNSKSASNSN